MKTIALAGELSMRLRDESYLKSKFMTEIDGYTTIDMFGVDGFIDMLDMQRCSMRLCPVRKGH
jgi:hypothetical protein